MRRSSGSRREVIHTLVVAAVILGAIGCGAGEKTSTPGEKTSTLYLVADLAPGKASSNPSYPTAVGERVYFHGSTGEQGGLCVTDGTAAGTRLLARVGLSTEYGAIGSTLFFAATDDEHGNELWNTDGTPAGTVLVDDINPGGFPEGGVVFRGSSYPRDFARVNGTMFFTACDGIHGWELWRTDGTQDGTYMVRDIDPRPLRADATHDGCLDATHPTNLRELNGRLYFFADDEVHGRQLWTSNGTPEGTVMLKEVIPPPNPPYPIPGARIIDSLTKVEQALFFVAVARLWKSDGSAAGTMPVADVWGDTLIAGHSLLFFVGPAGLWKSDGTSAGTSLVKELSLATSIRFNNRLSDFETVGDRIFFTALIPGDYKFELWTSDGTPDGTYPLTIGPEPAGSEPASLIAANGWLYFTALDRDHGRQLWRSDGSLAGTSRLTAFTAGVATGSDPRFPGDDMASTGRLLFFPADDGVHGRELWALRID
jgi:ELWxxDGT repeat protein